MKWGGRLGTAPVDGLPAAGQSRPDREGWRALTPLAVPVYVPTLLQSIGFYALAPMVTLLGLDLGFSVPVAAALAIISGLAGIAGPIPAARLMARLGERRSLIITGLTQAFIECLGWAIISLGSQGPTSSLSRAAFIVVLVAGAVAAQTWQLGRQSTLGSALPSQFRARGMSTYGGVIRLGMTLGPTAGALVAGIGHARDILLVDAVSILAATAFVAWRDVPLSVPTEVSRLLARRIDPRMPSPNAPNRPALNTMLLASLSIVPLVVGRMARPILVPLVGVSIGMSASLISITFAAVAVLEILVFVPAGAIMDRFGSAAVVVPCLALLSSGYFALITCRGLDAPIETAPAVLVVASSLIGIGNGLGAGIVTTLGVDLSPRAGRITHLARWNSIQGIGRLIAPSLVGFAVLLASFEVAEALIGAICLAAAGWAWGFLPRNTLSPRHRSPHAFGEHREALANQPPSPLVH